MTLDEQIAQRFNEVGLPKDIFSATQLGEVIENHAILITRDMPMLPPGTNWTMAPPMCAIITKASPIFPATQSMLAQFLNEE